MKRFHCMRCFAIALCLLFTTVSACTQTEMEEHHTPQIGQRGKDVIWLPTQQDLVETMLDVANVTSADYVIDLGSGDGRMVIAAAKRGATALGIEYNSALVNLARRIAAEEEVGERVTFEKADIFESDFSKATVITMFLLPELNLRLRAKILDMKPGTRIVSNTFDMEKWVPDQTTLFENAYLDGYHTAHLWVVPAKLDGSWKLDEGKISFIQEFQNITGTMTMGKVEMKLSGKLNGDKLVFTAGGIKYTGTVSDNTIFGTHAGGGSWKATR